MAAFFFTLLHKGKICNHQITNPSQIPCPAVPVPRYYYSSFFYIHYRLSLKRHFLMTLKFFQVLKVFGLDHQK
jgi:hypothetical protein